MIELYRKSLLLIYHCDCDGDGCDEGSSSFLLKIAKDWNLTNRIMEIEFAVIGPIFGVTWKAFQYDDSIKLSLIWNK